MFFNRAALPVYGNSREIAHMLIRAGKLVKQGGLSAVLISGQGKGKYRSFGKRVFG